MSQKKNVFVRTLLNRDIFIFWICFNFKKYLKYKNVFRCMFFKIKNLVYKTTSALQPSQTFLRYKSAILI